MQRKYKWETYERDNKMDYEDFVEKNIDLLSVHYERSIVPKVTNDIEEVYSYASRQQKYYTELMIIFYKEFILD